MGSKPWNGVFRQATDPRVEAFTDSTGFDSRLARQDIQGSIAHAEMLARVGLLTSAECQQIIEGLDSIGREISEGRFVFRPEFEDVHMNIEAALIEKLGDTGRKLHTGRSRNDQVSTDFRLWIRTAIDILNDQLRGLQQAFVDRCEPDMDVMLPGYTHMRRAQPVLAAHYWLAYCEKFERDRQRLADCRRRVNRLPLGTAALAGTSLPIDRDFVANKLGFDGLAMNSLDASSDRDFASEFAFCLAMIAEHLSGWAEEWILWSTHEFGFLRLPQAFCTGSSIMPQKINPDVLELIRGKTARVLGNLQALLVLLKGLPLAYNRDYQEDKERVFDSYDTVVSCLEMATPLVAGVALDRERIEAGLDQGYLDATTLMEYLIRQGVPQRTAHHTVGLLVASAMRQNKTLAELAPAELQAAHPALDQRVQGILGVQQSVEAMQSVGSTGPAQVRGQLAQWHRQLAGGGQKEKK
ncbi:MAG: argininosuccinate lyase [Pirellulales bacterium]|nr:argininosuccinate lyase [Pirellulales bacterium]